MWQHLPSQLLGHMVKLITRQDLMLEMQLEIWASSLPGGYSSAVILFPSSPLIQNHRTEDGIIGSSAPASRVSTDIWALCLVGDGVSALGLLGMGQAEVGKGITGLYQYLTAGKAWEGCVSWRRGVPWLAACTISVLHSGDVPVHALCLLPHYNAHGNEAAGDELVCSELCLRAGDLLSL